MRLGELARGARVVTCPGTCGSSPSARAPCTSAPVSGDVAVGVAKGVDLHVDVETLSGTVHSDIPLDDAPARGGRPETRVDLSVRSVSGNVEIGRALEHVA